VVPLTPGGVVGEDEDVGIGGVVGGVLLEEEEGEEESEGRLNSISLNLALWMASAERGFGS
jgi:hypothetical protein